MHLLARPWHCCWIRPPAADDEEDRREEESATSPCSIRGGKKEERRSEGGNKALLHHHAPPAPPSGRSHRQRAKPWAPVAGSRDGRRQDLARQIREKTCWLLHIPAMTPNVKENLAARMALPNSCFQSSAQARRSFHPYGLFLLRSCHIANL
jgi:hypothetical protein